MGPAVLNLPLNNRADVQRAVDTLAFYNARWLREHRGAPRLYQTPVRYEKERVVGGIADERWQTIAQTLQRGVGDCEDLATWRAAEVGGRAVAVPVKTGYHIVVERPDGQIEDPSRALGMGAQRRVPMRVRPTYVIRYMPDGGAVGYLTDGRLVLRCRVRPPGGVGYQDVGRRRRFGRRLKRFGKKLVKSKVLRGLAKAALQVAKLYPGTGQAIAALELGLKAAKAARGALKGELRVNPAVVLQSLASATAEGRTPPQYVNAALQRYVREAAA